MKNKIEKQLNESINEKFINAMEGIEWATIDEIMARLDLIPNFGSLLQPLRKSKSNGENNLPVKKCVH